MNTNDEARGRLERLRSVLEDEGPALARLPDQDLLDVVVEIDECNLAVRRALAALDSGLRRDFAA
jgi:hypothetical protein